jgi:cytochrome c oxidase subunit 2
MDNAATVWLPPQSSTMAGEIDALFYFLCYVSAFFLSLITGLIVLFVIKYRRKGKPGLTSRISGNRALEVLWTAIPTTIVMIIFAWGFRDFMRLQVIPHDALEIRVSGMKWSWNLEYAEGARSVNELVVPVNRPVKLLMSSRDVIHSFFVPAFRVKMDVLPNRYTNLWFNATQTGEFPFFCTEYCGQQHSLMRGTVRVLTEADYAQWIADNSNILEGLTPAKGGELLYNRNLCYTCHSIDGSAGNGPTWLGLFGSTEQLTDGTGVLVDENHVRESILEPAAKVTAGYDPIMPTYQGILNEEQIDAILAFMKTLRN